MPFQMRFLTWLLFASVAFGQTSTPAVSDLTITGDISATLTLKPADFALMPHQTVSVDDQDGTKVRYEGVALQDILKKAGLPLDKQLRGKMMASYIVAKAHDGYQVVFSLGELGADFGNELILVADKRDGKPLFGFQGPLRLVCPKDKAGARSVRMLENIEVVRLQK